ncbi:MAG: NUDIX hydrolase [Candidatus Krumholzibacteriia bacterium]
MTLQSWIYTGREEVADARIFKLLRETAISPRTGAERTFAHVESPTWVNMIPLTAGGDIVLVRQWRHGVKEFTLEVPGGLVDQDEEPSVAAAREVREETGYAGDPPLLIGTVQSNPAFMANLTHTYLIENCHRIGELDQDESEDLEVAVTPLVEIPRLVAGGAIRHSLVICAFWWLAQRRPDLLRPAPGARRVSPDLLW